MNHRIWIVTTLSCIAIGATGCDRDDNSTTSAGDDSQFEVVDPGDLTAHQRAQLSHAESSRGVMGQQLMGTVNTAAEEAGFAHAIDVCQEEAEPIAEAVSEERNVAIGRTSAQLRNPDNRPPEWAKDHVASDSEDQLVVLDSDDTVGTAVPIHLAAPCANCHGHEEQLAEGVPEALHQMYPDDRATGYDKGDLRGWFWVEAGPEAVDDRAVERAMEQLEAGGDEYDSQGEKLYDQSCASCHGDDGQGVPGTFPPLVDTERVTEQTAALIAVSLDGMDGPVTVDGHDYDGFMPGQAQLDDEQMAQLLTYIRNSWGNDADPVTPEAVETVRDTTMDRTAAWTDEELNELADQFDELP